MKTRKIHTFDDYHLEKLEKIMKNNNIDNESEAVRRIIENTKVDIKLYK